MEIELIVTGGLTHVCPGCGTAGRTYRVRDGLCCVCWEPGKNDPRCRACGGSWNDCSCPCEACGDRIGVADPYLSMVCLGCAAVGRGFSYEDDPRCSRCGGLLNKYDPVDRHRCRKCAGGLPEGYCWVDPQPGDDEAHGPPDGPRQ
jgi:hypothetical protein